MAFSKEAVYEIWDDDSGDHWEVGQDRDALGLVEIRFFSKTDLKPVERMTFPPEIAEMLAFSINKVGKDLTPKQKK